MGDQIYADATAGLLDPSTKFDRYSMPYLHLYEQQHVRSVLRKLPSYNMLDDHEIIDNWEPVINNDDRAQALKNARDSGVKAFLKYQRGEERQSIQGSDNEPMWYHFCQQQHDFFMCDTRTQRAARTAENIIHPQTTIIDETQHSSLEKWLQNSTEKSAKFVLSSSMLLPRHAMLHGNGGSIASAIRTDSWDGYPVSLHRLLAFLVDQQKDNIVFLSGDDHIACFAEIDITNEDSQKSITTWSAHCPGLYTPFPFANGRIDDFEGELDNDQTIKTSHFEFQHNKINYRCRVKARFGHSENQEIELGPINIEVLGGFLLISTR
jgi:phosphodiesterase/alkaline phosphatase D-like protein